MFVYRSDQQVFRIYHKISILIINKVSVFLCKLIVAKIFSTFIFYCFDEKRNGLFKISRFPENRCIFSDEKLDNPYNLS